MCRVLSFSFLLILRTPLYDALAADGFGNTVRREEQGHTDEGFGNADHRGERDLVLPDTDVVHIQVEHLDHVLVHGVLEDQVLLHAVGQDARDAHPIRTIPSGRAACPRSAR